MRYVRYVLLIIVWLCALFITIGLRFLYKNTDIFKMSILHIVPKTFETTWKTRLWLTCSQNIFLAENIVTDFFERTHRTRFDRLLKNGHFFGHDNQHYHLLSPLITRNYTNNGVIYFLLILKTQPYMVLLTINNWRNKIRNTIKDAYKLT